MPVLPLEVNASQPTYTIKQTTAGQAVRIPLASAHSISQEEIDRSTITQPCTSLQKLHARAQPKISTVERLVRIGARAQSFRRRVSSVRWCPDRGRRALGV
ncbi:hypothetical protein ACFQ9J_25285 [Streptomyces sp. NPDC056529]|uniref:helix-hairpin-helix domain-containing protein n=1 Tax=Streptomyces sp. NPDC056529 TaxID=3345855 RepID=UPI00368997A3